MKLKTSYFNPEALRKNITRFAPVWALYTLFWLMVVFVTQDGRASVYFAMDMGEILQFTPIVNLCYALLCAQLLFGDLYRSHMCNALHAMPVRREGWFLTHVISGLLFSLVPNLLVALVAAVFMGAAWVVAPLWLMGNVLQYFFFFGAAVLSAYCVGNRFAMALVYGIIQFFSLIAYWLIESLYAPMLYGVVIDLEFFCLLSPIYTMCVSQTYVDIDFNRVMGVVTNASVQIMDGWGYLVICAGIGLVLMAVAWMIYRRRNLESAGDFMAVKALGPVFLVLYCLCGGAVGYLFFSLLAGEESLFFLVVGMTVGWFTGRMLLERTVRVFRKKNLVGYAVLILVFFVSLGLTKLDPLGIIRWMPKAQQVESVTLTTGGVYYQDNTKYVLTTPEDIAAVLTVHRYGIVNQDADYNRSPDVGVTLSYQMKNGTKATRHYAVDLYTEEADLLQAIFSRKEFVLDTHEDAQSLAGKLRKIVNDYTGEGIQGDEMKGLLEAVMQDCEAGNMAQERAFQKEALAVLVLVYKENMPERYIWVYDDCEHTWEWIKAHNWRVE